MRGTVATVYHIEITRSLGSGALDALELEIRDLARRYGAEIEDFRVEARRGSG
jgi:tRNA(Ser,Leu) C12 N-acetylase TAN1